jgi:hypothetical protein
VDPPAKIRHLYRWVFGREPEQRALDAGLRFMAEGSDGAAPAGPPSPWHYGIGEPGGDDGRIVSFTPFPVFVADRWQGGSVLPATQFGKAVLRAAGGEPGDESSQSVILRWVSPVSGTIGIEGTLRHNQPAVPYGDGVRGHIVSGRLGNWRPGP